jgi:beta-aspartyl-peptidase (threonine type)
MNSTKDFAICLHGGAGVITRAGLPPQMEAAYRDALDRAIRVGYELLAEGKSALDAVEAVVRSLEDNELFNAGRGSVFARNGKNEMDASIVDGRSGRAGAVAGVSLIRNPITLARTVMEKSAHVMLIGAGAEEFARQHMIEFAPANYFYTDRRWNQLQHAIAEDTVKLDHSASTSASTLSAYAATVNDLQQQRQEKKFGTVGCVARDKAGHLAAATSTGGMTAKLWGRVGDSPIVGAGTFADDDSCAVSCTGAGEYFIRNVVAYDICARMKYAGRTVDEAARDAVERVKESGGDGE